MINSVSGKVLLRLECVNVPFVINNVDRAYTIFVSIIQTLNYEKMQLPCYHNCSGRNWICMLFWILMNG